MALTIVLLGVLLMPLSSAWDFDNVLNSNNKGTKYSELTIKNAFGMGSDIAKMEILDDNAGCFIDCYAIINVTLYQDNVLPVDFKFYNARGNPKSKTFNYYTQVEDSKDVIEKHYKEVCKEVYNPKNLTNDKVCHMENDYDITKEVKTYDWKKYKGETMPAGSYIFRIEAKKLPTETLDWTFSYLGITEAEIKNQWAWWSATWTKRMPVNITGGSATMYNFTVFLNASYSSDMQADFDDVRFVSGACSGTQDTELNYERAFKVDSSSANFWVKIPALTTGYNELCMYYGNPSASYTADSALAWDGYYWGVYHFDGNTLDSTKHVNGTIMTTVPSNTTQCVFGSCYTFGAANSYVLLDSSFDAWDDMTIESYGYLRIAPVGDNTAIAGNMKTTVFEIFIPDSTLTWRSIFWDTGLESTYSSVSVNVGKFNYLVAGFNGWNFNYVNETMTKQDGFTSPSAASANSATIGAIEEQGTGAIIYKWLGNIDEVRFSKLNRTDEWIQRSRLNNNYSSFTFGTEEMAAALTVDMITPLSNQILNSTEVFISCNTTSGTGVLSLKIYGIDELGGPDALLKTVTNTSNNQNLTINYTTECPTIGVGWYTCGEGGYIIYCRAQDADNLADTSNRTFYIDIYAPAITTITPLNGSYINTLNATYNVTFNFTSSDTVNLSTCWYNNGTSDVLTTCNNNTYIRYTHGWHTFIYYANDTINHIASNTTTFLINQIVPNVTYNETILEARSNAFTFTIDADSIINTSATMNYAGTLTNLTLTDIDETSASLVVYLTSPYVTSDTIYSFNITYYVNGQAFITQNYNQTVVNFPNMTITALACDEPAMFFPLYDENNLTILNGTIEFIFYYGDDTNDTINKVNGKFEGVNNISACTNSSLFSMWTLGYGQLKYYAPDSSIEYYNIVTPLHINGTVQTFALYDITTASGEPYTINLISSDQVTLDNAIVQMRRKYVDLDEYLIVEAPLTDNAGSTIGNFVLITEIYDFYIYLNIPTNEPLR
jgi:hypothetical protein